MSIFKCKMCGGNLNVPEGATIAECEYCGTKQTLPKLDDDQRANLYDRANHFRRNNEFDKAMGIYEKILNEDKTDAEAYWSLVLCRYGIEYVEDPSTHKRVPTVNRAQYTSVFDDDNYKSALHYADTAQKEVYEAEAKAINEIQKGILAISQKEEPFDVFICYKETDKDGRRTPDSVLANDLYHQLTQEGFKVFFSRITLEDKLGTAYEPYIFAALNSSKVMVVLGTKPEHFNAVWVKNEWSRYLSLIRNGANKILIPAYRDMDPYDLPEEFSHLQAQDMNKLGFMQDLIRGIKKVIGEESRQAVVKETVVTKETNTNYEPLLERAFMFLEDGNWTDADAYCEKVLDLNPKCAEAYLGKLMAELCVHKMEKLADCADPFDGKNNYQKILRFGSDELISTLGGYIKHINERNELARLERIYSTALKNMQEAKFESSFKQTAKDFQSISNYKNSAELAKECLEKAEITRIATEKEKAEKERKEKEAKLAAEKSRKKRNIIITFVTAIISTCLLIVALLNFVIIPNVKYNSAMQLINENKYIEAYKILSTIGNYKDSKSKADNYLFKAQKNGLSAISLGESVKFGCYEQDNDKSNGREEIEWLVIFVNENRALLVSKYLLDIKPYHSTLTDITWKDCSLRFWLNNDFINSAFSSKHQELIMDSIIPAVNNPSSGTKAGVSTTDKIFILNINEVEKYFPIVIDRQCQPTDSAIANSIYDFDNYNSCWWLRSPGNFQKNAAGITNFGSVDSIGAFVNSDRIFVRPAMWISIK